MKAKDIKMFEMRMEVFRLIAHAPQFNSVLEAADVAVKITDQFYSAEEAADDGEPIE